MPADEVARDVGCSRVSISRPMSSAIATVAAAESVCGLVGSASFGARERYPMADIGCRPTKLNRWGAEDLCTPAGNQPLSCHDRAHSAGPKARSNLATSDWTK